LKKTAAHVAHLPPINALMGDANFKSISKTYVTPAAHVAHD